MEKDQELQPQQQSQDNTQQIDYEKRITELENNANFITIQDVEAKNYLVAADIAGKADKDNVYTKTDKAAINTNTLLFNKYFLTILSSLFIIYYIIKQEFIE